MWLFRFLWLPISVVCGPCARLLIWPWGCTYSQLRQHVKNALCDASVKNLFLLIVRHATVLARDFFFAIESISHMTNIRRCFCCCYLRHLSFEQSRHCSLIAKSNSICIKVLQTSNHRFLLPNAIYKFPMMKINRRISFSLPTISDSKINLFESIISILIFFSTV